MRLTDSGLCRTFEEEDKKEEHILSFCPALFKTGAYHLGARFDLPSKLLGIQLTDAVSFIGILVGFNIG